MGLRYFQAGIATTRSRTWLATLVVSVALAASCGLDTSSAPHQAHPPDQVRFDAETNEQAEPTSGRVAARTSGAFPERSRSERIAAGQPPLVGPILVATAVGTEVWSYTEPTAGAQPEQWFPNPTQFGGPRVFRVIDGHSDPGYVQVSLPSMPNGQTGWVERHAVELSTIEHQVLVDLSEHSVTVWHGDDIISDTGAVTGAPATPTPLGVFFVRDIIEQPNPTGAYGPQILALSGFSETLSTFNGGLPAIAIHGTDNPALLGQERSNGCVRVPNDIIEYLADRVPLGTPVTIVA